MDQPAFFNGIQTKTSVMDLHTNTLWFEIALVCAITAFGSIFFGHFEEHTPKWRRVLKLIFFIVLVAALSRYLGRPWALGFLGLMILTIVFVHGYWLPQKKGIHGLTGEPKRKYYEMRGWTRFLDPPPDEAKNPESD